MSNNVKCQRAMILARGLGTRMQKEVEGLKLDAQTAELASKGAKMLIDVGRPFLDHTLQALLDAGLRDFCLIIPPDAPALRSYYAAVQKGLKGQGVRIAFAVQDRPVGTANAVLSGQAWAGQKPFMVYNSDNFYPPQAVTLLANAPAPATLAFDRESLIGKSNIPADRIQRFAVIDIDDAGQMRRIIEKPDNPDAYARDGKLFVSMNCFLFTPEIFAACRSIQPDPVRKEYELPTAVQYSIEKLGQRYAAVRVEEGVLDLTGRGDIEPVRRLLAGHEVRFAAPQLEVQ